MYMLVYFAGCRPCVCSFYETDAFTYLKCLFLGGGEDYQLPYAERVAHDPSLEEMKKLVAIEEYRPPIPNNWQSDQVG